MAVAAALGRMRSGAATRQAALGGGAGRRLAELTESRGGRWLLGRSVEGELLLWDARHGYAEQRLARGVGCLPPHAFSLDEAWLVLPEGSGPAQVLASWDLTAPRRPTRVSGLPLPAAPATPAGPQVVDEAFVDALFDDLDPPVPPNRCQALAISQDGALVACAGADELLLYDLVTPWPQPTRRSYVDVIAMQFSTDGALWLQQSSTIRRLAPWETPELATVPPLATADGPATSGLTLAGGRRNGRCTVTATLDGVALWTAEVGTRRDSDPGAGPAQVSATRSRVVDWSPGTVAMVYDFGAPP